MDEQLLQYFSGELTAVERLELIHRIENDERLKTEFFRFQNISAILQLSAQATDRSEGFRQFKVFTSQIKQNARRKQFLNFVKYVPITLIIVTSTVCGTL